MDSKELKNRQNLNGARGLLSDPLNTYTPIHLTHLLVRNFRSYAHAELTLDPKVNLFLGDNGQGKTNLLEAIYLLSTGRSFRTRHLSELIRTGSSFFYVEGQFIRDGISHLIKIYYDKHQKKVQCDALLSPRLTSLLGVLPGVLISPEDHELISGAPSDRRRFFDIYLSQADPLYIPYLYRYFGALKRRNCLLKSKGEETLGAWETIMAKAGHYLMHKRAGALASFEPLVAHWIDSLSLRQDRISLSYAPSTTFDSPEAFERALYQSRPKERIFGSTLIGPHRDEIEILIGDKRAKDFSSEGQKRSTAAAIRLSEWHLLRSELQAVPLLSIDDFGIQLDGKRQEALEAHLCHFGQVFLTAAKPLTLAPNKIFQISASTLTLL